MTKDEQLYAVITEIRPVFRALVAAVEDRLSGTGLGVPERGVLECLNVLGASTVPSLAKLIGVPRQFVQRTCNGLLEKGLLTRLHNPAHAKSDLMELTQAGRDVFAGIRAREADASRELAEALQPADLQSALNVLRAMRRHYENLPRLNELDPSS